MVLRNFSVEQGLDRMNRTNKTEEPSSKSCTFGVDFDLILSHQAAKKTIPLLLSGEMYLRLKLSIGIKGVCCQKR